MVPAVTIAGVFAGVIAVGSGAAQLLVDCAFRLLGL